MKPACNLAAAPLGSGIPLCQNRRGAGRPLPGQTIPGLTRGALPRNIIAQVRALALTGTRANQHKRIKLTFSVNGCIGYTILRTICDEPLIYKYLKRSFHTKGVFHALLLFGIVLAINFGVLYKLIESALKLGKYYPQPKGPTREQVWGRSALCAPGQRWHWAPYLLKPIKLNIEHAKLANSANSS